MMIGPSVSPSEPIPSADEVAPAQAALPDPATYDALQLRRVLDGRWAEVRERARNTLGVLWADSVPGPPARGLSVAEQRERTLARFQRLLEIGDIERAFVPVDGVPPESGRGLTIFEMAAMVDPSLAIKLGVQLGLFGGAITHLGTSKHHERYLPLIGAPQGLGCFAMTETGHGSNVQGLRTTATYDPRTCEFVIDTPDLAARKDYIGNAAQDGRVAVVFAQLVVGGRHQGVHALVVPLRDAAGQPLPGVTIEDDGPKGGLNGVDNGRLSFHQVRVPRDALLDRYASVSEAGEYSSPIDNPSRRFFTMIGTLVRGRVAVAGAANGAAKTGLTIAVHHALTRRQFSRPGGTQEELLLDYPLHQRRLFVPLARAYALHFAQTELIDDLKEASGSDLTEARQRDLEARAASVKALATDVACETLDEMRQACGGAGFLAENQIAPLRGDIDIYRTFEGDNTVLRLLVGRSLVTGAKETFELLDPRERMLFVGQKVLDGIRESTPVRQVVDLVRSVVRRPGGREALRQEQHLDLFARWEDHVVGGLADRLRGEVRRGTAPADAFTMAAEHVIEAAKAHADNLVLQAFVRGIARCEDPSTAALLGKVCDLYALSTLDGNAKKLLQHGLMSPDESKAVEARLTRLCAEIRPYAGALVDGLGIPDEWITAPIGRRPPQSALLTRPLPDLPVTVPRVTALRQTALRLAAVRGRRAADSSRPTGGHGAKLT